MRKMAATQDRHAGRRQQPRAGMYEDSSNSNPGQACRKMAASYGRYPRQACKEKAANPDQACNKMVAWSMYAGRCRQPRAGMQEKSSNPRQACRKMAAIQGRHV
jgi:hypothetical protein